MKRRIKKFEAKVEDLSKAERVIFYLVVFSLFLSIGMMIGFMVAKEKREYLASKENDLRIAVEQRVLRKLEETKAD